MARRVVPDPALQARPSQRERHKQETRTALVGAACGLIRSGNEVTMPAIARRAGVSDATAYRHFPDLLAILREGFVGVWPDVSKALPELIACTDPVDRIGIVTTFLAENVLSIQGAVRAMISLTVTRPDETAGARPGYRIDLIDRALEPLVGVSPVQLAQLKSDLSIVVSAESLFTLLDLQRLDPDIAVANLAAIARTLVRAALSDTDPREQRRPDLTTARI